MESVCLLGHIVSRVTYFSGCMVAALIGAGSHFASIDRGGVAPQARRDNSLLSVKVFL